MNGRCQTQGQNWVYVRWNATLRRKGYLEYSNRQNTDLIVNVLQTSNTSQVPFFSHESYVRRCGFQFADPKKHIWRLLCVQNTVSRRYWRADQQYWCAVFETDLVLSDRLDLYNGLNPWRSAVMKRLNVLPTVVWPFELSFFKFYSLNHESLCAIIYYTDLIPISVCIASANMSSQSTEQSAQSMVAGNLDSA